MLGSGVDPNQEFAEKNALCLAASRGNEDIVRAVLDAGNLSLCMNVNSGGGSTELFISTH